VDAVARQIKNSYRKLAVHTGTAPETRAAELGLLQSSTDKPSSR